MVLGAFKTSIGRGFRELVRDKSGASSNHGVILARGTAIDCGRKTTATNSTATATSPLLREDCWDCASQK